MRAAAPVGLSWVSAVALEGTLEGGVYRVAAPSHDVGVMAPFTRGELLFGGPLTGAEIARRHHAGAEILAGTRAPRLPEDAVLLLVVRRDGELDPVTAAATPAPQDGDRLVMLGAVPQRRADAPRSRASPTKDEAAAEP